MSKLDQSIIATIAYFDVFEYPLTSIEVWKWLHNERVEGTAMPATPLGEVLEALKESPGLKEKIEYKDGFYFLRNRERCILTRSQRYRIAERKWARAVRFVRLARITPFVRLIAICNSLSYSNARRSSDIDFFVMTARGRIWTVRLLLVWIMKLLRLRPRRGHMQDTFCFSFFVSEQHLDLSDITLGQAQNPARCQISDDVYFTYWLSQLVPIYDESDYYAQLWQANGWIKRSLPNIFPKSAGKRRRVSPRFWASFVTASVEWLLSEAWGDLIERVARALERAIMPAVLKQMSGQQDSRVVINDQMLKMHRNDRRMLYWHMWHDKIRAVVERD